MGEWLTSGTTDYTYQLTSPYPTYQQAPIQWVQPLQYGQTITITDAIANEYTPPVKKKKQETAIEWLKNRVEEIRLTPAMMMAAAA